MWPFGRRKKRYVAAEEQLAGLKVDRKRLELKVAQTLVESNPELAARYLLGSGRQVITQEKSLAERYFEKKILGDGDEDGLDKLEKLHNFYQRKRDEMGLDGDDREGSALERALERFGGPVIQAIAAAVNPAGYHQAMAQLQAEQQVDGQTVVTEVPPSKSHRYGPPMHELSEIRPAEPEEESSNNMLTFPITPAMVLTNLSGMPPSEFARWALGQQAVAGHMVNLASATDEELAASLATAETNPLFGQWRSVFGWLRANPERTQAIIGSVRQLLAYQTEDPDDIAL